VIIATRDNVTTISWKLDGTISNGTASSSIGPRPTGAGTSSEAQEIDIAFGVMGMMIATCFLGFTLR
jgi:hypothetical protein